MTPRRIAGLLVSLAVGAACLAFAFRGIASTDDATGLSWASIGDTIAYTEWWGYATYAVLFAVQFLLRSERWRVQVRGLSRRPPTAREALGINGVANAAVFLLPFRLGEFVRPNICAQRGIMSASAGLAATALERVIDGIVTTGMFGVVLVMMRDREVPAPVRVGGFTALAVFGGALVFFVVAFRWRSFTTKLVERVLGVVHGKLAARIGAIMRGFLDGLACFKGPGPLALYVVLSVAYWMLNGASMYVLLRAMHIDVEPLAAFFTLCVVVIGVMIPAPPGNVGNFHAFAKAGLATFGVAATAGISYAIVLHLSTVVCLVVFAAVFLALGDVTLARLRQATTENVEPALPPS